MKNLLLVLLLPFTGFSKVEHNCFPDTNYKIPATMSMNGFFKADTAMAVTGLTQIEFEEVINKFSNFWSPIIMNKYQKKLVFENDWDAQRVNASATRDDDNNPVIKVSGGLARHPEITKNGLILILCHELGHHLGGAPKSFRGRSKKRSWSSAEGQADYFATTKCMPKMVLNDVLYQETVKMDHPQCQNDLCKKIAPAALSVGNLFASLKGEWERPSIETKSPHSVFRTFYQHPTPQCRLDTFIAGSLCSADFDIDFDNSDHKIGSCLSDLEPEAARPKCWFSHSRY